MDEHSTLYDLYESKKKRLNRVALLVYGNRQTVAATHPDDPFKEGIVLGTQREL